MLEHCIIRRFDEAMFQNSFSPTGWLHRIYTQYCVWGFPLYNIRYKCFFLHKTLITERLHFSQSYRLLVILCNGIITTIIGGTALQDMCVCLHSYMWPYTENWIEWTDTMIYTYISNLWQSWVEIEHYFMAHFDHIPCLKRSNRVLLLWVGLNVRCVNSWMLDRFTKRIWAPPFTEVLCYRFKCGNVNETCNGIMLNFYLGLPHLHTC